MLIYKDIFSGDELLSDSYTMRVVDGVVYEVEAKMIVKKEGSYDMAGDGAGMEELDDPAAKTVNNIVDAHQLVETAFDKKSYMAHIKAYMVALKKKLEETKPDRVKDFQAGCNEFVKRVIKDFDDYSFFVGSSMASEGQTVLLRWEGTEPRMYYFVDGLQEIKV